MNEKLFQGQSSTYDNSQDNNQQDKQQKQNDQLVFKMDRSLNLPKYRGMVLISNDEKYLVIVRVWRIIQIYYLKNKKLIKNLELEDMKKYIVTMKFSNNSRYLLFGDNYGCLGCYDINNNYKIIYNQMVHSDSINNILAIDDEQILTSSIDVSLIITNIQYNQQLLRIETDHFYTIKGIEFDKQNDFIISCSYDCSIKLFNRKDGKLEIAHYQKDHRGMFMIQLIQKDSNLLSSSKEQLILWQIDYINLQLIRLKEFNNNQILSFTPVFNNNKILVICDQCIQILDKDLVVVQSIKHQEDELYEVCIRQLDSLNYIFLKNQDSLIILKKVGKLQN